MFKYTTDSNSAIEVIFIILLGLLFLSQTLGKLINWIIGKFRYTGFNGKDIIHDLSKKHHFEKTKINEKKFDIRSPFYSYNKKKDEFTISHHVAKDQDLAGNMYVLQSVAYADEKRERSLQTRWQFIGVALLSIVPYLFFMASMLLIYCAPRNGADNHIGVAYYIPVEIFCVLGWVVILITYFWWMSIINNVEIAVEDLAKELNNRNILENLLSYMKVSSYIPFSYRTVI